MHVRRGGARTATAWATIPPIDCPKRSTRSQPRASTTATTSAAIASMLPCTSPRRRADAAVADGDDVPLLGEPVHDARVPVVEVRTEVRQRDEGDAGPWSELTVDDVSTGCRDC
ncbi:hypothetical protein ASG53_00025 [Sanguibacter sp. Leaf3]|nr:hypothetical protein ASG53_00025 [Sanguibacter sp. Leaf3]